MSWRRTLVSTIVFLATAAIALQLPGPLLAGENLLSNPEFAAPLLFSGWTIFFGSGLDWTGADSNGCASSGAAQLGSATTDVGTQWAEAGQCQILDNADWTTGAHAAFSYFSFDATLSYAQFLYYADTACGQFAGAFLGLNSSEGPSGPGWHRVEIAAFGFPAGAHSVLVAVGAEVSQATPMELLFDRAYFGHLPVVFTDDFETDGGLCRWSAALP